MIWPFSRRKKPTCTPGRRHVFIAQYAGAPCDCGSHVLILIEGPLRTEPYGLPPMICLPAQP